MQWHQVSNYMHSTPNPICILCQYLFEHMQRFWDFRRSLRPETFFNGKVLMRTCPWSAHLTGLISLSRVLCTVPGYVSLSRVCALFPVLCTCPRSAHLSSVLCTIHVHALVPNILFPVDKILLKCWNEIITTY